MALGKDQIDNDHTKSKEDPTLDTTVDSNGPELKSEKTRARFGHSDKSVGGRIAPVLPHLRGYDFGSDESGEDIIGKQIELESGNAIQYRTCSWPKASHRHFKTEL